MFSLHPLLSEWFSRRFSGPTEPQRQAWPLIQAGCDVLISAPTGSGKTLAAFLICLDRLVRDGNERGLPPESHVLYVSPLKALSNDVQKNANIASHAVPLPSRRTVSGWRPRSSNAVITMYAAKLSG